MSASNVVPMGEKRLTVCKYRVRLYGVAMGTARREVIARVNIKGESIRYGASLFFLAILIRGNRFEEIVKYA